MSGHSKWANIKHKKGAADRQRSKEFGKLAKEIMVAVKMGGTDPDSNPRLRAALVAAKAVNLPKDNIERAVKKGAGGADGVVYEEIMYEGYGPGGVAILVEVLTDNRNRSVGDVRMTLDRNGGNLAASGSVAWIFQRKTRVVIEGQGDEDFFMELALDAGADEVETEDGITTIVGATSCFEPLMKILDDKKITTSEAGITYIPDNSTEITEVDRANSLLRLIEKLEDLDDVQSVYHNMDVSDTIADQLDS